MSVVTVAVAATAEAAAPRVVVQKGIAGIRLGMSPAEVKAKAGAPRAIERGASELGRYTTYRYPTHSVTFFGGSKVTQMQTTSPLQRTAAGIGVGSTRAALVAKVRGVRCRAELGFAHCSVGVWKPGGTVTDFVLEQGRVARVAIGYVID